MHSTYLVIRFFASLSYLFLCVCVRVCARVCVRACVCVCVCVNCDLFLVCVI